MKSENGVQQPSEGGIVDDEVDEVRRFGQHIVTLSISLSLFPIISHLLRPQPWPQ